MESANIASKNPPIRHPIKYAVAGNDMSVGAEHCKSHSDTTELSAGASHAQELLSSLHGFEEEEQIVSSGLLQCHVGATSVKTEMKVCCASKTHARVTSRDGKSWVMRGPVIQDSIVSSIDERRGAVLSDIWKGWRGLRYEIFRLNFAVWNREEHESEMYLRR